MAMEMAMVEAIGTATDEESWKCFEVVWRRWQLCRRCLLISTSFCYLSVSSLYPGAAPLVAEARVMAEGRRPLLRLLLLRSFGFGTAADRAVAQ